MDIQILGTCAAEGIPSLFCNCETCRKSRELGGRNIRSRSSILIDDIIEIDLPPDTFYHSINYGVDTSRLRHVFITHSHRDHFYYSELGNLNPGFAQRISLPKLQVYGNCDVIALAEYLLQFKPALEFHVIEPFEILRIDGYQITAIKAKHGADESPLNYIISKDGKSFLYACDTAFYEERTWNFLTGRNIDLAIVECTAGRHSDGSGRHMGLPEVLKFREKAESINLATSSASWIITHFSHNCGSTYDEMAEISRVHNIEVAFDGMRVCL